MARADKVLHIFASKSWGGGEQYVYDLAMRQKADGRKVVLVARRKGAVLSRIKDKGFVVYTLSLAGLCDVVSILKLASIIRKERPDVVHTHNFKDAFQAVFARFFAFVPCRLVCTRHIVKRGKNSTFYKWLYRKIDKIVFVSHLAKECFLQGVEGAALNNLCTLHSGIMPSETSCVFDLRKRYSIPNDVPMLMYSGRIVEEKGCHVLYEACSLMADKKFALFMAGSFADDEYKMKLEDAACKGGFADKIIYLGFVDNIKALLPQVDICVIPTIVPEAFGLSVAEAMIAGCAVVTTNCGAQKEFLKDGVSGVLVPANDARALLAALENLMDDESARRSMGNRAALLADVLSYDKFYASYVKIYEEENNR